MAYNSIDGDVGTLIMDKIERNLTLIVLGDGSLLLIGRGTFSTSRLRAALAVRKHLVCIPLREEMQKSLKYITIYNAGFEVRRAIQCYNHLAANYVAIIGEKDYLIVYIDNEFATTKCKSLEELAEVANCAEVDSYVGHIITLKTARQIRKIKEYIKYAPGGPAMAAKTDFTV